MRLWPLWLPKHKARLSPEQAERLAVWNGLPADAVNLNLEEGRYVVVDVETSGLNPRRDRLLSIGAVCIQASHILVSHSLDMVLRSTSPLPSETILIHGISPAEMQSGVEPVEAMLWFLEYAGKAPLVGYHTGFDRQLLERACWDHLGINLPNPWLDLAWTAPALCPEGPGVRVPLDAWLTHFALEPHERHRATADALVTAELFLILQQRARQQGHPNLAALRDLGKLQVQLSSMTKLGGA